MPSHTEKDYYWLNQKSEAFLKRGYLLPGQTAQERVRLICETAEKVLGFKGFADKLESYIAKGWISCSTPIWANFGNQRGLPISCYGQTVEDTLDSILYKCAEAGKMSKVGGGTSAYFGKLRSRGTPISVGGTSSGPVHFMELFNTTTNVVSQSNIRRGNFAAYIDINHPDILEFLKIKSEGNSIQHIFIGVCVTDAWMEEMIAGDKSKRDIWAQVLKKRFESGLPYIFFTDTVNNNAPQVYKDKGKTIYASNLCAEICLSSSGDESFVCNLAAMNLLHYDAWKDTDAVETAIFLLDAVMSEFIKKTEGMQFMEASHKFAVEQRALGLGVLGWHSLLQANSIPFESLEAKLRNADIFSTIRASADKATETLAAHFGEPPLLKGYGRRNVTTMALMPTTSSSFILGQISPSIEPLNSNFYVKDLDRGKFTYKNPYLKAVLHKHGEDTKEVWETILEKGGSVQHLEFLSDHERDVFKTFDEISQKEIIIQASQRQKHIDQAQSLNITIHPNTSLKDVNSLMIDAWRLGCKSLYYQRSVNPSQELNRNLLECKSCAV